MREMFEKAAVAVASLIILPLIGESVVVFIQRGDYDVGRAAVVAMVLAALAGLLFLVARIRSVRPRAVALLGVIVVGSGLFALGLFLTLSDDPTAAVDADTVYSLMITSGALMVGAGIFLMFEHGRSAAEDRRVHEVATAERAALEGELTQARQAYQQLADTLSADPSDSPTPHEINLLNIPAGHARVAKYAPYSRAHDALIGVCQELLDPVDLHYVAYYIEGECVFTADIFDDRKLARFFSGRGTPDFRRRGYESYGRFLFTLMTSLNAKFRKVDSGILLRIVLDVEKGALYYYYVEDDKFAIGVTMDQAKVHEADRKMVTVVDEIRVSLGHRPIADLNR